LGGGEQEHNLRARDALESLASYPKVFNLADNLCSPFAGKRCLMVNITATHLYYMGQIKDETGNVHGRWQVVGRATRSNSSRQTYWHCICTCGSNLERDISGQGLRTGHTTGCGTVETGCNVSVLRPYEAVYRYFLRMEKRDGHARSLSYEDFINFTKTGECHYCTAPIKWLKYSTSKGKRKQAKAYNLDRKDDSIGYTTKNVVVCCKRCNWGKGQGFTYDEWWMMTACFRKAVDQKDLQW
jgi:hypothetical protein